MTNTHQVCHCQKKKKLSPFKTLFVNNDYDRISNGNFYLNKTNTLNNSLLIIVLIELKTPTKNDQYSPCSKQIKKI